jgi:hypothetical protein
MNKYFFNDYMAKYSFQCYLPPNILSPTPGMSPRTSKATRIPGRTPLIQSTPPVQYLMAFAIRSWQMRMGTFQLTRTVGTSVVRSHYQATSMTK